MKNKMKSKKKFKVEYFYKFISLILLISILTTSVPIMADEPETLTDDFDVEAFDFDFDEDCELIFEERPGSYLFKYDELTNKKKMSINKNDLVAGIEEAGGIVEDDLALVNCISALLTKDQMEDFLNNVNVKKYEKNYDYNLQSLDKKNNEELEELYEEDIIYNPFDYAHSQNIKGKNIKVAVFDTGIAEHPDLTICGGISFANDSDTFIDYNGHGTKVAGIIAALGQNNEQVIGAAPSVELYSVKLVGNEGFITTAKIIKGIEWAIQNKINIINMSFGEYYYSDILEEAINIAFENNIIIVASAGNDGDFEEKNKVMYPAAYENVISAGAGNSFESNHYSNLSEELDFVSSGYMFTTGLDGSYEEMFGTSVSSANITGVIALLWSKQKNINNETLINLARNAAVISGESDNYIGFGEIVLENAIDNFEAYKNKSVDKLNKYDSIVLEKLRENKSNNLVIDIEEAFEDIEIDDNKPIIMSGGVNDGTTKSKAIPLSVSTGSGGGGVYMGVVGYKPAPDSSPIYQSDGWFKITTNSGHPSGTYGLYYFKGNFTGTIFYNMNVSIETASGSVVASCQSNGTNYTIKASLNYNTVYYLHITLGGMTNSGYMYVNNITKYNESTNKSFDTATSMGDIYNNKSITCAFTKPNTYQYFYFYSTKDCEFEVFQSNSDFETYSASLYTGYVCQQYIKGNMNGNGNGNIKITHPINSGGMYYIVLSNKNNIGTYKLNFKFKRDYVSNSFLGITDGGYKYGVWTNNNRPEYSINDVIYNKQPSSIYTSTSGFLTQKVFIDYDTAYIFHYQIILGRQELFDDLYDKIENKAFWDTLGNMAIHLGKFAIGEAFPAGGLLTYIYDIFDSVFSYMNIIDSEDIQFNVALNNLRIKIENNNNNKFLYYIEGKGSRHAKYQYSSGGGGNNSYWYTIYDKNNFALTNDPIYCYGYEYERGNFGVVTLR